METNPSQLMEILGELFSLLEAMETSNLAVVQFLKDKGIANEKEFAHFMEQAGNASSVKWRAARVRMEYLLTPIKKENLQEKKNEEKKEVKDASPPKEQKEKEQKGKDASPKEPSKEQKPGSEKGEKLIEDLGAGGVEKTEAKKGPESQPAKDEQNRTEPAKTEKREKNPKKQENK